MPNTDEVLFENIDFYQLTNTILLLLLLLLYIKGSVIKSDETNSLAFLNPSFLATKAWELKNPTSRSLQFEQWTFLKALELSIPSLRPRVKETEKCLCLRGTHNYYRLAASTRGQGSEYNLIQEDKKFSKKTSLMFSQLGNQYEDPTFSNTW